MDYFNKRFFGCGVFLKHETRANQEWAVSTLRMKLFQCYLEELETSIIAIDRDLALKGALETIFESSTIFICRWDAKCKKQFLTDDDQNKFMVRWNRRRNSFNEEERERNVSVLRDNYRLNARYLPLFAYRESTWVLFVVICYIVATLNKPISMTSMH